MRQKCWQRQPWLLFWAPRHLETFIFTVLRRATSRVASSVGEASTVLHWVCVMTSRRGVHADFTVRRCKSRDVSRDSLISHSAAHDMQPGTSGVSRPVADVRGMKIQPDQPTQLQWSPLDFNLFPHLISSNYAGLSAFKSCVEFCSNYAGFLTRPIRNTWGPLFPNTKRFKTPPQNKQTRAANFPQNKATIL